LRKARLVLKYSSISLFYLTDDSEKNLGDIRGSNLELIANQMKSSLELEFLDPLDIKHKTTSLARALNNFINDNI